MESAGDHALGASDFGRGWQSRRGAEKMDWEIFLTPCWGGLSGKTARELPERTGDRMEGTGQGQSRGPRFSSRVPALGETNALTREVRKRVSRGEELVDLTESNPTRVGLRHDATILEALRDARGLDYDPDPRGIGSAREAVASLYSGVDPGQILLTTGTSEAYGLIFKLLGEAGAEVLVPRPSYPLLEHLAAAETWRAVPYPLRYAPEGWRVDLDRLEASVSPRTRAVVVIHPNNPTGNYLKPEERRRLVALCRREGLALVVDEVFREYPNPAVADPGGARGSLVDERETLVFVLDGLSKRAGLPQMKLGWIVVGGPREVVREALSRLEFLSDLFLSVSTPVQWAAPRLLDASWTLRERIHRRVLRNEALLRRLCAQEAPGRALGLRMRLREGGWYAVLDLPPGLREEAVCLRLVQEAGVLVHPGHFYDFREEGVLVLSLLPEPETFHRGVLRLRDVLEGMLSSREE
jgi:hypothetical protein